MFRRSVADMSSIAFILRKSLKNNILELLRHPGKLVAYLFVAACLLFSALSMALSPQEELPEFLDLRILQGIYFALLMFIVMINLIKGVDSGSTFFSMGDVNMLFISPISPKKILVYGLMKQMGMTVLVACCMVAYGGMAVQFFGITALDAVLLFAGFIVSLLVSQIFTILIYSFCNGSRKRSAAVKRLLYAAVLLVLAYVAMTVYEKGFSMETVCAAVTDPYLQWVPIIGWMTGGIFSAIRGFDMMGAVYFALLAAAALIALLAFLKSDSDYYEDVLQKDVYKRQVPETPIAQPMSAALRAGASLMPSPVMATTAPRDWNALTIRTLCSGETRANTVYSKICRLSSFWLMASSWAPVRERSLLRRIPSSLAMARAVTM